MLVAIDIGNTNIHIGTAVDDVLGDVSSFPTKPDASSLDLQAMLTDSVTGLPEAAIVSSVVREISERMASAASSLWPDVSVLRATPSLPIGIVSDIQPAEQVGVDRLIAAGEAYSITGGAAVVVGMGTAMTVDAVSADGRFVGGTISPGLNTKLRALNERTSLLPDVKLGDPGELPGRDTPASILGGVVYGTAGAADRLVEELRRVVGEDAEVLVTGGDASFISPFLKSEHRVEEHLVLRGLIATHGRLEGPSSTGT